MRAGERVLFATVDAYARIIGGPPQNLGKLRDLSASVWQIISIVARRLET
jgi:hypothetical protein